MTPTKPDWIVIANATRARILARERGEPMAVVKTFSHPEGRGKVSDLADDRAGHGSSDHSWGGSAYPPRIDAKRKEHERFATELGAWLERAAEQDTYRSLALLASNPFLGELKAELGLGAAPEPAQVEQAAPTSHTAGLPSFSLASGSAAAPLFTTRT